MIDSQIDSDGILTLTIDMPGKSMNVFDADLIAALDAAVKSYAADPAVKGVILASGKSSFIAGADIRMFEHLSAGSVEQTFAATDFLSGLFRRVETSGKPTVCALNGTALGGGLELALACHYRVAADAPGAKLGLPEVQLGILPGAGGTQRLPRLIGIQQSLILMTEGKQLSPAEAQGFGIVHKLAPAGQLLAEAKSWLLSPAAKAVAPWDEKGFKIPGGGVQTPMGNQIFTAGNAMLADRTWHVYPAPLAILSCVYEGLQVPFDTGLLIERRYLTQLLRGDVARNMTRTVFVNKQAVDKGFRRPAAEPKAPVKKLGVIGAGFMGAAIGFVAAQAGIAVVLLDTDQARADKGREYAATQMDRQIKRGRMTPDARDAVMARISASTDYAALAGCDLVIEAVIEDIGIKAKVTKAAEAAIGKTGFFASNTSTLPITDLAKSSVRPDQFLGIHFFSPVEKMALVEIIRGKKTSDAAVAKAMDFVAQIRKTPIVVNDSRGFYANRVILRYFNEGLNMLAEGIKPALIENAARLTGMPVGPLNLIDEVKIDLAHHILQSTRAALGAKYKPNAGDVVIEKMFALNRLGKSVGKGFYDYPEGGEKSLWPGLAELCPVAPDQPSAEELRARFLYVQALEALRTFEDGTLESVIEGDVAAIFGWGFAPWTGGPFSFIDTVGAKAALAEANRLARAHGERFKPPRLLRQLAASGGKLYAAAAPQAA